MIITKRILSPKQYNKRFWHWVLIALLVLSLVASGIYMAKSREKGINPVTRQVQTEVQITGKDPCDILKLLRRDAEHDRDKQQLRYIYQAEKFFGCRNRQKRQKR